MVEKKVICPFCCRDISNNYSLSRTIPQEEIVQRKFSHEHTTWSGSYLKETKYIRKFQVLCCEDCYEEYVKNDAITKKMASFAIPIGLVAGVAFIIYVRYLKNNMDLVSFDGIVACIIGGILGAFVFSIPTAIVNLAHSKKVSYKRAKECNANLS